MDRTEWYNFTNPLIRGEFTRKLCKHAIEESLVALASQRTVVGWDHSEFDVCEPLLHGPGSLPRCQPVSSAFIVC